jgi:hypothetical protein
MTDAIDVNSDATAKLAALKPRGIGTVFGYISSINPHGSKCITPERAKAIAAAGLHLGIVHEGWGGVGGKGISAADGVRDGAFAVKQLPLLGAPPGACCYFACDQDFSAGLIQSLVLPYFRAIDAAFKGSPYLIGVYGSGATCMAVIRAELADKSWLPCSTGWSGYKEWLPQADIVQHVSADIAGLHVDSDTCKAGDDVGTFVPFAPSTATAPAPAVKVAASIMVPASGIRSFISRWI